MFSYQDPFKHPFFAHFVQPATKMAALRWRHQPRLRLDGPQHPLRQAEELTALIIWVLSNGLSLNLAIKDAAFLAQIRHYLSLEAVDGFLGWDLAQPPLHYPVPSDLYGAMLACHQDQERLKTYAQTAFAPPPWPRPRQPLAVSKALQTLAAQNPEDWSRARQALAAYQPRAIPPSALQAFQNLYWNYNDSPASLIHLLQTIAKAEELVEAAQTKIYAALWHYENAWLETQTWRSAELLHHLQSLLDVLEEKKWDLKTPFYFQAQTSSSQLANLDKPPFAAEASVLQVWFLNRLAWLLIWARLELYPEAELPHFQQIKTWEQAGLSLKNWQKQLFQKTVEQEADLDQALATWSPWSIEVSSMQGFTWALEAELQTLLQGLNALKLWKETWVLSETSFRQRAKSLDQLAQKLKDLEAYAKDYFEDYWYNLYAKAQLSPLALGFLQAFDQDAQKAGLALETVAWELHLSNYVSLNTYQKERQWAEHHARKLQTLLKQHIQRFWKGQKPIVLGPSPKTAVLLTDDLALAQASEQPCLYLAWETWPQAEVLPSYPPKPNSDLLKNYGLDPQEWTWQGHKQPPLAWQNAENQVLFLAGLFLPWLGQDAWVWEPWPSQISANYFELK